MAADLRRNGKLLVRLMALLGLLALVAAGRPALSSQPWQPVEGSVSYFPLVTRGHGAPENLPRIHAPGFDGNIPFEQAAIAWFGQVSPVQNDADVRVGYTCPGPPPNDSAG